MCNNLLQALLDASNTVLKSPGLTHEQAEQPSVGLRRALDDIAGLLVIDLRQNSY